MVKVGIITKGKIVFFLTILILSGIILFGFNNNNEDFKDEWEFNLRIYENHTATYILNRTIISNYGASVPIELYKMPTNELFKPDFIDIYYEGKMETIKEGFSSEKKLIKTFELKSNEKITFSYKGTIQPNNQSLTFGDMEFYNGEINIDFYPNHFQGVIELPYPLFPNYSTSDRYIPVILIGSYINGIEYTKNNFDILAFDLDDKSIVYYKSPPNSEIENIILDFWAISLPNPKLIITQNDEIYLDKKSKRIRSFDLENNQNSSIFYKYNRELNILNITNYQCGDSYGVQCIEVVSGDMVTDLKKDLPIHSKGKPCSKFNLLGYPFECWEYESETTLTSEFVINETNSSAFLNYQLKVIPRDGFSIDTDKSDICFIPKKIQIPLITEDRNIFTFSLNPETVAEKDSIIKCTLETGFFTFETPKLIGKYFSIEKLGSKLKYNPASDVYSTERLHIPMSVPYPKYVIKSRFIMVREFEEKLISMGVFFIYLLFGFYNQKKRNISELPTFFISGVGLIPLHFSGILSLGILLIIITSFILGWIISKNEQILLIKVRLLYDIFLKKKRYFSKKN